MVSTCAGMMEHSFTINSVIQGCHIYKGEWGKVLYCERELGNCIDPCAVALKRATLEGAILT